VRRRAGGLDLSLLRRDAGSWAEATSFCPRSEGVEAFVALLLYFSAGQQLEGTRDDDRLVRFEHIRCPPAAKVREMLQTCTSLAGSPPAGVNLHCGRMEAPGLAATAFVNFAGSHFGYGRFICSCTQGEILRVCCPEFNVGMLFIGRMGEDEVVNVLGCRRFSAYEGYLRSCRCTGPLPLQGGGAVQGILTLDACVSDHFLEASVLRDIGKAYTSFASLVPTPSGQPPVVSTGRWGCKRLWRPPRPQVCPAGPGGRPRRCPARVQHLRAPGGL
jgi:hypothetical protein